MRWSICTGRSFSLCEMKILFCLIVFVVLVSTSAASDGTVLSWNFQSTGFTAYSGLLPQTAVAMRDGRVWPVIFSENSSRKLQAYSLYPVTNPTTKTNWFQIGTNLLIDPGDGILSAATSPDGRVGAEVMMIGNPNSAAVVGGTPTGFGGAMTGVQAIDFDKDGNLITGTLSTLPVIQGLQPGRLVDIAVSPLGDLGALDDTLKYYQNSPLMGGWGVVDLRQIFPSTPTPNPQTLDLALDSLGRPHIVGLRWPELVAYDFDITSGQWKIQTLGTELLERYGATIAADSHGGVGAAWVKFSQTGGGAQLMYAYKKCNNSLVQPDCCFERLQSEHADL